MRFLRRSLVGIFLLSVTLALLAWAGMTLQGAIQDRMSQEPRSFPQRERVFAVNTLTLTPGTLTPELTAFGEIRSRRTLDLRSAVGGTVLPSSPVLDDGAAVKQGDTLLLIDPANAQSAKDRAAADLADASAELRDAERAIALARDELTAAEEQATLRQSALTRARDLQTRGVGTATAVETAELALSAAQAAILSRRQSLAQAEARYDQAVTRLVRADINLAEATRALEDTRVIASFDGTLADVTISPGGRIGANERFASLVDATELEVVFRISTAQYARLLNANGALIPAQVTVGLDVSGVDLRATGTITRESATVGDGQTGRQLFARLDTAPGFRPGDFVTLRVAETPLDNVVLVPATAVAADDTVLVIGDGDRLESAQVQVLRRQGDDLVIAPGAQAGAMIVAERSPLLGAGIKVNPIAPGGTPAAAPEPAAMITLDPERRARLVAFVSESQMPDDAKARVLSQLEQDEVPAETVTRIESRMGG